ncbi:hypothetical protein QCA50_005496 [Cerrena zonata]|uniref:Uncharacterized protein n=1 Tax=Cerrena zonata TaxID=2478898 RepID=A0AAW0GLW9_9APHY
MSSPYIQSPEQELQGTESLHHRTHVTDQPSTPTRDEYITTTRARIQSWMHNIPSHTSINTTHTIPSLVNDSSIQTEEIGRLIEILYPPQGFDHIDLRRVHHLMGVCRDEALFHLMAAEHRMRFFVERLESSRRELERVYLNYCRAVEILESGLDPDNQNDAEIGGEGELDMAFVQPADNRDIDLNDDEEEEEEEEEEGVDNE